MNDWPYHQYFFFQLDSGFYRLGEPERSKQTATLLQWAASLPDVPVLGYSTLGFKPDTAFMLWLRGHRPEDIQDALRDLLRTEIGQWLTLTASLFGLNRPSTYSRGPQKADQVMTADERLPYLIIYPFTKTHDWHQLSFDQRRQLMGAHVRVGIQHKTIRQCLLHAYGVDDHEFIVSYETPTLEAFQDLVMELRANVVRPYTQNDLPIYTCIYKPLKELAAWL